MRLVGASNFSIKYPFVVELIKTNLPTVKISKDFIDYQNNNPQIKKAVNDAKNFLKKGDLKTIDEKLDFLEKQVKINKILNNTK